MRMGSRAGGALRAVIELLLLLCLLASCREATIFIDWQKCLAGSENDEASGIQQTADNGYMVAGFTDSGDGDVNGFHHDPNFPWLCHDFWVLRLTPIGKVACRSPPGCTCDSARIFGFHQGLSAISLHEIHWDFLYGLSRYSSARAFPFQTACIKSNRKHSL
jgi:hypothetical protein